jgi:hypothetical protein
MLVGAKRDLIFQRTKKRPADTKTEGRFLLDGYAEGVTALRF